MGTKKRVQTKERVGRGWGGGKGEVESRQLRRRGQ